MATNHKKQFIDRLLEKVEADSKYMVSNAHLSSKYLHYLQHSKPSEEVDNLNQLMQNYKSLYPKLSSEM